MIEIPLGINNCNSLDWMVENLVGINDCNLLDPMATSCLHRASCSFPLLALEFTHFVFFGLLLCALLCVLLFVLCCAFLLVTLIVF